MNSPWKKPKMEEPHDVGLIGGSFDPGAMGFREDADMNRSGSDNLEAVSGDGQESSRIKSSNRSRYHRHTAHQIQELEAVFKVNPHPDEKERLELSRELNLESRQIKFWFQNKRTQLKAQVERHENLLLKQENNKLRIENIAVKESLRNLICGKCGGELLHAESTEGQNFRIENLRIENARLKNEINRACALTNKIVCGPLSSLGGTSSPPMLSSNMKIAVRRNGSGSLGNAHSALSTGLDLNNAVSDARHDVSVSRPLMGMHSVSLSFENSMFLELALTATAELIKLAQNDTSLWFRSLDGSGEMLNFGEYMKMITPCIDIKPRASTDGTKATSILAISSMDLVEVLMNTDQWAEMFSDMIGSSSTLEVISSGINGTKNCALQLMQAEIQVISPLVPVRQMRFLRFCKQHVDGVWVVVDVSIDTNSEGSGSQTSARCRRLPSGCIVQDTGNGCSKVTWVEHCEYDESAIHDLYRPLIRSGLGYGAQRWLATLQRQCDFLTVLSTTVPGVDHSVVTPNGRRRMAKLAQRMTRIFCAGVCATVNKWEVVQDKNMGEDIRFLIRKGIPNPGEPSEVVLSATMSVQMPVQPHQLFEMLQDEERRSQWDVLSHGGQMQQMIHISKGLDYGKSISLLRHTDMAANINQDNMLRLQETSTDLSGSLIVYAAVEMSTMNMVLNGRDSSCVALLPSGFAIVPDCFPKSKGPSSSNGLVQEDTSGSRSLLTISFQILLNNLPTAQLTKESVNTMNTLMSRTIQGIKDTLGYN
ncbi:hypothetical protein AgCh_005566 [Apium graveolens]